MPFSLFFLPCFCTFFNHYTHSHSLSYITHLSLSLFLGIALYIKHVLNRIVYVLPTYRLPAWCLSCLAGTHLLSSSLPASPYALLGAFACSRGGGWCFVMSCSCFVLPCLSRSKLIDCPSTSVSSFVSFLSLFCFTCQLLIPSTSKRRASLSHTCTTTKFDNSI